METISSQPQPAAIDPTRRFTSRVENYIRYRPVYPPEIIPFLKQECGLTANSIIADTGSGTGKLAELFLANGNRVFGVEPNREMREASERLLGGLLNFHSVDAKAEATTLPDHSADFVTAGQAFHWFDRERCKTEFARILKPGGWVVLVWNDRHTDTTPFLVGYEKLLHQFATDYAQVDHKRIDDGVVQNFFGLEARKKIFPNFQEFDLTGLKGRLLSSSYVPNSGEPKHDEMLRALEKLFAEYERSGRVRFDYDTVVYFQQLLQC